MRSEEFDMKVRSMLQERKINPEPASWEHLEGLLDEAEAPGRSAPKLWFVAASVAVIMLMGVTLVLTGGTLTNEVPLVEQDAESSAPEKKGEIFSVSEEAVVVNKKDMEDVTSSLELSDNSFSTSSSVTASFEVRPEVKAVDNDFGSADLRYMPVVTNKGKTQVSDRELEELLADARAVLNENGAGASKQVDAALLLADIEEELDQNFKDKALDALKTGLVKLRTAVAERNQ